MAVLHSALTGHLSLLTLLTPGTPQNYQCFVQVTTNKLTSTTQQSRAVDSGSMRGRATFYPLPPWNSEYLNTLLMPDLTLVSSALPQTPSWMQRSKQHSSAKQQWRSGFNTQNYKKMESMSPAIHTASKMAWSGVRRRTHPCEVWAFCLAARWM